MHEMIFLFEYHNNRACLVLEMQTTNGDVCLCGYQVNLIFPFSTRPFITRKSNEKICSGAEMCAGDMWTISASLSYDNNVKFKTILTWTLFDSLDPHNIHTLSVYIEHMFYFHHYWVFIFIRSLLLYFFLLFLRYHFKCG